VKSKSDIILIERKKKKLGREWGRGGEDEGFIV
jgi:hypothetical protein